MDRQVSRELRSGATERKFFTWLFCARLDTQTHVKRVLQAQTISCHCPPGSLKFTAPCS